MSKRQAHYPGRPPIDAYGNGGFRFADMSHRGSLLVLPSGVYGWAHAEPSALSIADLQRVLDEARDIQLLLLGTGARFVSPPTDLRLAFAQAQIGLDIMDTGAAAKTYNVLLAENRDVAAALVAVN